jgi:hypothetical protein
LIKCGSSFMPSPTISVTFLRTLATLKPINASLKKKLIKTGTEVRAYGGHGVRMAEAAGPRNLSRHPSALSRNRDRRRARQLRNEVHFATRFTS